MVDWNNLAIEALRELGAEQTFARGAKARDVIQKLGDREGADLQEFLESEGKKFGEFLGDVPDVVIHRRPGTDMFVGFKGSMWPTEDRRHQDSEGRERFRSDVYEALTRVHQGPYYYIQSQDRFIQELEEHDLGDSLTMDSITLDDLVGERREFAESLPDEDASEALKRALLYSTNPLGAFQAVVTEHHLGRNWHAFKMERLRERLEKWAAGNGITVSPTWFVSPEETNAWDRPQTALARFAQYMTDEEIRGIPVPFRAVEGLYRDLSRGNRR